MRSGADTTRQRRRCGEDDVRAGHNPTPGEIGIVSLQPHRKEAFRIRVRLAGRARHVNDRIGIAVKCGRKAELARTARTRTGERDIGPVYVEVAVEVFCRFRVAVGEAAGIELQVREDKRTSNSLDVHVGVVERERIARKCVVRVRYVRRTERPTAVDKILLAGLRRLAVRPMPRNIERVGSCRISSRQRHIPGRIRYRLLPPQRVQGAERANRKSSNRKESG